MKLVVTKQFDRAVKAIKKKHDKKLVDELISKISDIYYNRLKLSDHPHKLKGNDTNGYNDVHISGDSIILYRYDVDSDTLVLSARLHNIVDHNQLNQKNTYKESQGFEKDFDDYIKEIRSSTNNNIDEINRELNLNNWFIDYYNEVISKTIYIDDIEIYNVIDNVIDNDVSIIVAAKGYQYFESVPINEFDNINLELKERCKLDNIYSELKYDLSKKDPYNDPDSYLVKLFLNVPLEYD